MTIDRELLELAAKAAGMDDAEYASYPGMDMRYGFTEAIWSQSLYNETDEGYWNPLQDDAHALRLAVKLGLHVFTDLPNNGKPSSCANGETMQLHGTDPYAATRRAIVRAAAEIGRQMP